jgi:hypothetical protein
MNPSISSIVYQIMNKCKSCLKLVFSIHRAPKWESTKNTSPFSLSLFQKNPSHLLSNYKFMMDVESMNYLYVEPQIIPFLQTSPT